MTQRLKTPWNADWYISDMHHEACEVCWYNYQKWGNAIVFAMSLVAYCYALLHDNTKSLILNPQYLMIISSSNHLSHGQGQATSENSIVMLIEIWKLTRGDPVENSTKNQQNRILSTQWRINESLIFALHTLQTCCCKPKSPGVLVGFPTLKYPSPTQCICSKTWGKWLNFSTNFLKRRKLISIEYAVISAVMHRYYENIHYSDVIMGSIASQITSLNPFWGADQRKHQSSASLAFVRGIHRWADRWIPRTNGQ